MLHINRLVGILQIVPFNIRDLYRVKRGEIFLPRLKSIRSHPFAAPFMEAEVGKKTRRDFFRL